MFGTSAFAQSPFATLGPVALDLSISEDITLADASTQASAFLQLITEPITVDEVENDTGIIFFDSVTEAISVADSSTQASTFLQSRAENINAADAQTITAAFAVSRAEPITIADSPAVFAAFLNSRAEPITVGDSSTQSSTFLQSRTEPITVDNTQTMTAQFAASVLEATTLNDVTGVSAQFAASVTEPITVNDTLDLQVDYLDLIEEAVTLEDAQEDQSAYNNSITEPVTVEDAATLAAQFAASISEAVTIDDVREVTTAFLASVTENINVAELIAAARNVFADITENIGVESVQGAFLEFYFTITENLAPADVAVVQAALLQSIAENINMFDGTAITGWVKVFTAQADTWALVNDSSGQTLPNIRDWVASATNGETTLVIGAPTSGAYYVARKYKQNVWYFSPLPFVFGSYNITNVSWLEDRFYLVGSKTGGAFIATSTDGLTWTEITAPTGSVRILDIARNGNTLVVAAAIRVYYSTNSGTSWTSTTRTLSSSRPSILWVAELNKFFVVGFNAYSSSDGATWTLAAGGGQGTAGYTGVAWSGSELVIAISNSSGNSSRLQRSSDGVSWTIFALGANERVKKVMWDGTQFVYYDDGNSFNYYTFTYNQAIDQIVENPNFISGYQLVDTSQSYNMVIVDGLYVIPGRQTDAAKNYFYTSTDLVTFSIPEYSGPWALVNDSAPTTWQNVNTFQ